MDSTDLTRYKEILNQYNAIVDGKISKSLSFLSVIGKDTREEYISRIVAYALGNEYDILKRIIRFLWNEKIEKITNVRVECEKYMNGRYADIFCEVYTSNTVEYTLTIENKTDTTEHDNQTEAYFSWVDNNYKNTKKNYFCYLCTDYNYSEPICNQFATLKYSELGNCICSNDYIIMDLKKHIENCLGEKEKNMDAAMLELVGRYKEIKNMKDEVESAIANIQTKVVKNTCDLFENLKYWNDNIVEEETMLYETQPTRGTIHTSFRVTKRNWYKKDSFYCYFEIRYDCNDNGEYLDNISIQEVLRLDGKQQIDRLKEKAGDLIEDYKLDKKWNLKKIDFKNEEQLQIGSIEWCEKLSHAFYDYINNNLCHFEKVVDTIRGMNISEN